LGDYRFIDEASKARSTDELGRLIEERLAELRFERFALGLIAGKAMAHTTILLDNLGRDWWAVARGDNPQAARQLFVDLVIKHDEAYVVPVDIHADIAARLKAAGHYIHDALSTIVPVRTDMGVAYLLVIGPGNEGMTDACKQQLSGMTAVTVHNWMRLTGGGGTGKLTPRETEILRMVADGKSSVMVAEELAIAPRTVEAHLASTMRKLDARNRTAAVVAAIRNGMIDL
jgi:DNA-binding CsgD family transcriptional regulator